MNKLVFCLLALTTLANAQGRIFVSHDVNTFASQFGGEQEQQFAVNIAAFLTGKNSGNILAIESNPSDFTRNYSPDVKTALSAAGFTVTYSDTIGFTLQQLQKYDAVFTGIIFPSYEAISDTVLTNYVNQGGNVFIYSGVGAVPALEASLLNPFLSSFGLEFDSTFYNQLINQTTTITSMHPVFNDVTSLSYSNGQSIIDLKTNPNAGIIQFTSDQVHGLYAVVDPELTDIDRNSFETMYIYHQNFPNPFTSETTIKFELPESEYVNLAIYNKLGQKIRGLINDQLPAGTYEARWDGRNSQGVRVTAGVYFGRFLIKDSFKTHKILFLR